MANAKEKGERWKSKRIKERKQMKDLDRSVAIRVDQKAWVGKNKSRQIFFPFNFSHRFWSSGKIEFLGEKI